jgi:hypothetical protein
MGGEECDIGFHGNWIGRRVFDGIQKETLAANPIFFDA